MEYNTERPHLIIAEYGRHVQKMAQYLLTIKNREERTRAAFVVIQVMSQVQPQAKDSDEFRQKLWDHLHIITDFKLNVDSPFPKPAPEVIESEPQRLRYPSNSLQYKHYGQVVCEMINKATEYKDSEEKDALVEAIACLMKRQFMTWNKTTIDDQIILRDLWDISGKKLKLKNVAVLNGVYVPLTPAPLRQNTGTNRKRNKKQNFWNKGKDKKQNRNGVF